jgi:hypothetical protein
MGDKLRFAHGTTGVAIDPPNGDTSAGIVGDSQDATVRTKGGMARIRTERGEVPQAPQITIVNAEPALFLFIEQVANAVRARPHAERRVTDRVQRTARYPAARTRRQGDETGPAFASIGSSDELG